MDQESNKKSGQANLKTMVCDSCGHKLTVKMPSKPDKYKFTCPHCQNTVLFVVKPDNGKSERKVLRAEILDDSVISRRKPDAKTPVAPPGKVSAGNEPSAAPPAQSGRSIAHIPVLGTPVMPPGKYHYQLNEKAQAGRQYRFGCPGCHKDIVINPRVAGKTMQVKCSKCATVVRYKTAAGDAATAETTGPKTPPPLPPVSNEAEQRTVRLGSYGDQGKPAGQAAPHPPLDFSFKKPHGMLCWKTGSLVKRTKTHRLMAGRTTIGRYDPDKPSIVMISGDDEMSRQSVEINVFQQQGFNDHIYELRILRSTNTIYINGRPVDKNKTVHLSYGDTIRMGKTNISFIKAND